MTAPHDGAEPASSASDYVQSLARGLAVIRAFSDEHPRQSISDIARRCSLSRPAARRFLLTLVKLEYVGTDGTYYWLTPHVLELGSSYLSSLSLPDLAQPHLTELSASVNESSSLCVLDGFDSVYVARIQVHRIVAISITVGTRWPAFATAMGRVLIAGLPEPARKDFLRRVPLVAYNEETGISRKELAAEIDRVRSQGFCITEYQREFGLRSAAAPVWDRTKNTIAAVNVSASSMTYSEPEFRDQLLPHVLVTADKISADIVRTGITPVPTTQDSSAAADRHLPQRS
jgi:IclR family pca regulon transcriptional regulator